MRLVYCIFCGRTREIDILLAIVFGLLGVELLE
jgi:hypothetical protein